MSVLKIYTNTLKGAAIQTRAILRGLKLLKPAFAGFVCVATPLLGVGYKVDMLPERIAIAIPVNSCDR